MGPRTSLRILVTGSRDWARPILIAKAIVDIINEYQVHKSKVTLVHGDCPTGADRMAANTAQRLGINIEPHPAEWDKYGRSAGPKRNRKMVELGADICLVFNKDNSKGTLNTKRLAQAAGIPIREVKHEDW